MAPIMVVSEHLITFNVFILMTSLWASVVLLSPFYRWAEQ